MPCEQKKRITGRRLHSKKKEGYEETSRVESTRNRFTQIKPANMREVMYM
ncbi:hypothetical protein AG1IA_02521 [Rhizoctonia solani AG-1 IA]|uniref:Uncharacterized protein n=1 Tax=Thanatephorus cucumeris (strain AG1-IA) TaxID=983506 RepID=L8X485_THACA|nr:hypothetical protein AG1IA_02521 [Rhizoctonia solani AG-1 IA]